MSYTAGQLVACPNLQDRLDNVFNSCNSSRLREPMPLFEFIMSPANRGGLQARMNGQGKTRDVELTHDQRYLESQVSTNASTPTCTATTQHIDNSVTLSFDTTLNKQIERKIPITLLVESCRDNMDYMLQVISEMKDALVRAQATKTTVAATGLYGKWNSTVNATVASSGASVSSDRLIVKTKKDSSIDPYPTTFQAVQSAIRNTNYCGNWAVFSGSYLYDYINLMQSGCCAQYGLDLGSMFSRYGFAAAYDKRVASAMAETDALVIQEGALQMVYFNLYGGPRGVNNFFSEIYSQQVIYDEATGMPIDMTMKVDCGVVHIVMTVTGQLFGMPSDLYQIGDEQRGVNGVNAIRVTNV